MNPSGTRRSMRSTAVALLSLLLAAAPLRAQDTPRSATDSVYVTQSDGQPELYGALVKLDRETLRLLVESEVVDVPLQRVLRIDIDADSIWNGAVFGAIVAGLSFCAALCPQSATSSISVREHRLLIARYLAMSSSIGLFVGAGIDGMWRGRTTVFQRSTTTAGIPDLKVGVRFGYGF